MLTEKESVNEEGGCKNRKQKQDDSNDFYCEWVWVSISWKNDCLIEKNIISHHRALKLTLS